MENKKYVTIRWLDKGLKMRDEICKYYNIPKQITINGTTGFYLNDEKIARLRKSQEKGVLIFLTIEEYK